MKDEWEGKGKEHCEKRKNRWMERKESGESGQGIGGDSELKMNGKGEGRKEREREV